MTDETTSYPGSGPAAAGLDRAIEWASRSPFFAAKLAAAGVGPGEPCSWERWRAITPTTKDELRALESFEEQVVIAPRADIVEFWRSGGVTGLPLYYPRTAADMKHALWAFARGLTIAGVSASDTVLCSLPLGIHPAGQMVARAAEHLGAAVAWTGAGNQLASTKQVELVHELGATVWCGMASFGLHLGHIAEAAGQPLAGSGVHTVVTTAEPLSDAKRDLLGSMWGARVRDLFGMTEVSLTGAECGRRRGLHMWTQTSFCEVLDADSLEPVPPGVAGLLCVTAKATGSATPFLRWISGDIVRLELGCDCGVDDGPRLIHSGRTAGFIKVKGVNLNHAECEERLYAIPALRDFRVFATREDELRVEVESVDGQGVEVVATVTAMFACDLGVSAEVVEVQRGTIATALGAQVKQQRFVDERLG